MATTEHRVSHLDLLRRCADVEHAALRDDFADLRSSLHTLRTALVQHIRDERSSFGATSRATTTLVRSGQQRLLHRVDDLFTRSEQGAAVVCVRASLHLTRELVRQARLEAAIIGDHDRS